MIEYTGKTSVKELKIGEPKGFISIMVKDEALLQMKGDIVGWKLIIDDSKFETGTPDLLEQKAGLHIVEKLRKGYYEVTSGSSDQAYIVDIGMGCGCQQFGMKGPNAALCSHLRAVLRYMLRTGDW